MAIGETAKNEPSGSAKDSTEIAINKTLALLERMKNISDFDSEQLTEIKQDFVTLRVKINERVNNPYGISPNEEGN